ncbi:pyridoxal phosphate-dependent transferase [Calycina marina]|uniref:Pyridoxal phosphate-dependent transferase n=1 Tax=Calycina marina TaxID=1763456 RepID=A0A9P8CK71_9HELO|nr:pyridoxal phosphate-dependent transferase [Calycina marina]
MASNATSIFDEQHLIDHSTEQASSLSLSSQAVHADDFLNSGQDVAPPLHVSTTYRYNNDPSKLKTWAEKDADNSHEGEGHIYSRHTAPNTTRFEAILSSILKGPALTYSSGLSALHAALVFLNPKRIAIRDGYHGCHGVIEVHQKLTGLKKLDLYCDASELESGDVVHVETPLNPTGQAYNLKEFAEKAHSRGAFLVVDATFGPPPLQDPFLWGADIVIHSGTKYVGGHSDMLCGILAVNPERVKEGWFEGLTKERLFLGNVMGNMEGWLGIRSVRTLEVRVERQAFNAGMLVKWLDSALHPGKEGAFAVGEEASGLVRRVVGRLDHASLQEQDIKDGWLLKQMPNGFGPVFSITMTEQIFARRLPSKLALFHHATSLGGVESLIEWRSMTDSKIDTRLLRVSIGIEGWEDLRNDLLRGFKELVQDP